MIQIVSIHIVYEPFLNQKKIMQPSYYIHDMNELVLRDLWFFSVHTVLARCLLFSKIGNVNFDS